MTYETLRLLGIALAGAAFFWLGYRTIRAWPAEWAKPDHVGHYRALLVVLDATYAVIALGAVELNADGTRAGPSTVLLVVMSLAVLLLCWRWPHPKPFRREE